MFYPKNVPSIERILRIAIGILLVGVALFGQQWIGEVTPLGMIVLIGSAIFLVVTGFIGWCPACAMVGRKIKSNAPHETAR